MYKHHLYLHTEIVECIKLENNLGTDTMVSTTNKGPDPYLEKSMGQGPLLLIGANNNSFHKIFHSGNFVLKDARNAVFVVIH